MRRFLPLTVAALLLGGCNMVVAELPIFTPADAEGSAQLRPGVWLTRDPACEVDVAKPVKDWPDCADPTFVTADRMGGKGGDDSQIPYLLAGGEPRVMQMEIQVDPQQPRIFFFAGLEALRSDDQGRIVEARTWAVQCGPPPPPKPEDAEEADPEDAPDAAAEPEPAEEADPVVAEDGADAIAEPAVDDVESQQRMEAAMQEVVAASVTAEPLPGLTIKDGMCLVRTVEPLRNAARESLKWDTEPHTIIYWVRDGTE